MRLIPFALHHLVFPRILCVLGVAVACAPFVSVSAALAQDDAPTATASVTESEVQTGDSVNYRIEITGARGAAEPQAPKVEGLTITPAGRSDATQITGGIGGMKVRTTSIYQFNVETQRSGSYVIPAQDIQTASGPVHIEAVNLTVSGDAPKADPKVAMFAELTIPKKSAFLGEAIPAEVRAYFGARVNAQADANPILNGEGFSAQKFTPPRLGVQEVEGAQFHVFSYKTAITGVKTGKLSVGPVEMSPIVQIQVAASSRNRRGGYDPFDDPFFSRSQVVTKQAKLRSDPVEIEIKPLPAGAPPEFAGAIGDFKLEAEPVTRKAQVGDPVTVRLTLRGRGNFDRISAPALLNEKGLRAYQPSDKFKADDDVGLSGRKTFEQTVVAQSSRTTLPGYRFCYFDPAAERYVTLETPPIPVNIEGEDAPTPTPSAAASAAAPTPTPAPKSARDILYIRTDVGRTASAAEFRPVWARRGFWLAQIAPWTLLLGAGAWAGWRVRLRSDAARRAADAQRKENLLFKALQSERTGRRDFYSAAARLAQLRAAEAAGRPGAHLTATEVCAVKGLDPQTSASVEEIFLRHDELAYSGGYVAQEPVPAAERRGVLSTLDTIGRN